MKEKSVPLYYGNPPIDLFRLFQADPDDGFRRLFDDRRVFWSFNTRVAIRAACDVLGFEPGDEILVPAYNCGSEVDPLIDAGLQARLFPVSEDLSVDPARIEPLITDRTRAIYLIHYFGVIQPALPELRRLCDRHGLRLIEDCALSLLSGSPPAEGRIGDVSVFCFHKFVPIPEGGVLVVNAPDLQVKDPFPRVAPLTPVAKILGRAVLANVLGPGPAQRLMRWTRGGDSGSQSVRVDDGSLEDIPKHYYFDPALRGTRISAIALRQLRSFPVSDTIAARRANWKHYRELLNGIPGIRILTPDLAPETCPLNLPVLLAERDRVTRALQVHGISATPWWAGFNRNLDWYGQNEAIALKNNTMSLPLHQGLGRAHLEDIAKKLREAMGYT